MSATLPEQFLLMPKLVRWFMIGSILVLAAVMPLLPRELGSAVVDRIAQEGTGDAFVVALAASAALMVAFGWLVARPTPARLDSIVARTCRDGQDEMAIAKAMSQTLALFIMRLSCFESVALFGLVISVGTGESVWWVVLAAVALLNMLFTRFPSEGLAAALDRAASPSR
ncbi:MAG: hypothetical protein B7733_12035 [Myxococcales bacterium FL481]|nr:MAG: hypothetical protein B7733_12035 [Myxococcales bacterium FL481]